MTNKQESEPVARSEKAEEYIDVPFSFYKERGCTT